MSHRYDVFLTGALVEGADEQLVLSRLETLFRADRSTVERLLAGGERRVRRGCDKEEALRYRKALLAAGVEPEIRLSGDGAVAADAPGAVDEGAPGAAAEFTVLPPGSDVLRPEERRPIQTAEVDTSALSLAPEDALPHTVAETPPAPPNTDHLELAPVGADVLEPGYRREDPAVAPPTDHLRLQD